MGAEVFRKTKGCAERERGSGMLSASHSSQKALWLADGILLREYTMVFTIVMFQRCVSSRNAQLYI